MAARAALALWLATGLAGVGVRVAGAAYLCPDPICLAPVVGADDPRLWIALGHRALALVAACAVLVVAWRGRRVTPWAAAGSVAGVALQVGLGLAVERSLLAPELVALHLGLALTTAAALSAMAWPDRSLHGGSSASAVALGAFGVAVTGALAVGFDAGTECGAWPLCAAEAAPVGWLAAAHRIALAAGALGVGIAVFRGPSSSREGQQVLLRLVGLCLGADLALYATGAGAEFALAQGLLLHVVVVVGWWQLPSSEWLAAPRSATSPLPTPAPASAPGAPST